MVNKVYRHTRVETMAQQGGAAHTHTHTVKRLLTRSDFDLGRHHVG